jgi:DNA-directed RNA polymerase subunit beta
MPKGEKKPNDYISQLLNLKDLKSRLVLAMMDGTYVQMLDNTNPLAAMIHVRKVSLLVKGLLSKRSVSTDTRRSSATYFGRHCPVSTSEGETIGLIQHLSFASFFDYKDDLCVLVHPVKDGKVNREKIVKLKPLDEIDKIITDSRSINLEIVSAKKNSKFELVRKEEVDYVLVYDGGSMSLGINCLPRANQSETDRILTGGNMLKQFLTLKYPKAHPLYTEFSSFILDLIPETIKSDDFIPVYSSAKDLIVQEKTKTGLYHYFEGNSLLPTYGKTCRGATIHSNGGKYLRTPISVDQERLVNGTILRCAYMIYHGENFEDALLISDRV